MKTNLRPLKRFVWWEVAAADRVFAFDVQMHGRSGPVGHADLSVDRVCCGGPAANMEKNRHGNGRAIGKGMGTALAFVAEIIVSFFWKRRRGTDAEAK